MMFPEHWTESLPSFLDAGQKEALLSGMRQEPSVSVRLNPFKLRQPPAGAAPVPWSPYGYIMDSRPSFTMDPLLHAGAYYVQDSSAMFVGEVFRRILPSVWQGRPLRVLDLCAAPGGKTTDLAASLRSAYGPGGYELVANEVVRGRAAVLSDNVARWGDALVTVTSCGPAALGRLHSAFDIIVADVPCSGEGMFRKDPVAVADWSPSLVRMCAERQWRIICDVWDALRTDGILIYSTCTFSDGENDGNVRRICNCLGAVTVRPELPPSYRGVVPTECGFLLLPGLVPGEGQYCAALRKTSPAPGLSARFSLGAALKSLHPLRRGLVKGGFKGRDFIPSEDWALSLEYDAGAYPAVELSREQALKYLHCDTLMLPDAPSGFLAVCYDGLPLGFVKNLGSRCNNLHPRSRRILKDIQGLS